MLMKTIFGLLSTLAACHQRQNAPLQSAAVIFPHDKEVSANIEPPSNATDCVGGWNVINPAFSLIPNSDNIAVAMRGLCLRKEHGRAIWYSKVVIGTTSAGAFQNAGDQNLTFNTLQIANDPRKVGEDAPMVDCTIPELDHAEGSEDPRLITTPAGVFLIVAGFARVPRQENGTQPICGDVGFHLHASKVLHFNPPRFGNPVALTFNGMGRVEKNWAMFVAGGETENKVHAIYSVFPHAIATVDLVEGDVQFKFKTYAASVSRLAKSIGMEPGQFHGGGGVAHVKTEGDEYFLSMMHVGVEMSNGKTEYWNFPYKFQAHPPFAIFHIGKRVDLQLLANPVYGSEMVAFVTTMMYDQDDVFIGYGSGDRSARTLRMPMKDFVMKHFSDLAFNGTDQVLQPTESFELSKHDSCKNSAYTELCKDSLATSVCRACITDA